MRVKEYIIKLLVTFIILGVGLLSIFLLRPKIDKTGENGFVRLIIINENEVFNEQLPMKTSDSLLDLLETNFTVVKEGSGKQVKILSIKNEDLIITTDFKTNFIAFYERVNDKDILINYGAGTYRLKKDQVIIIKVETVWTKN